MIRFISFIILSHFCSVLLWSQGSRVDQATRSISSDKIVTFDDRYQGVKGTPYIFSEWQRGVVFISNMDAIHFDLLNFDRHSLELCHKETDDSKPLLINKYLVDSFQVLHDSDTLDFVRIRLPEASDYCFMELVYAGSATLFLDYGKKFIEANYKQSYSADRRYDEFKDTPTYFIRFEPEEKLHVIKTNKKQTSSLFSSSSQKMLHYLKSEKNPLKSRADMISMMKFYDSIK